MKKYNPDPDSIEEGQGWTLEARFRRAIAQKLASYVEGFYNVSMCKHDDGRYVVLFSTGGRGAADSYEVEQFTPECAGDIVRKIVENLRGKNGD